MSSTPAWLSLILAILAVLGTLGGVLITQWFAGRREDKARRREREAAQEDQWIADRRSYYLPLREAARDLETRLHHLARIYRREPETGFTPESLSADFRELYMLSSEPIKDLYGASTDPNQPRRDEHAVQRLRTRMNRELNFATSTVYRAARFLGWAQVNRRLLDESRNNLPAQPGGQLRGQLVAVSDALQGSGAGVPIEQQESIGEMMLTSDGRVTTQFEFRRRLLELPGWEQYTALLTFFITEDDETGARPNAARFAAKVSYEVRDTIIALRALIASLDQITALDGPPRPNQEIELRECPPPYDR